MFWFEHDLFGKPVSTFPDHALVWPLRPDDGLPDFGAAVWALIDEVDLRHAPMGLDVPHEHGQQSYAAGADNRSSLDFVMLDVGWHFGSPSQRTSTPALI
jgi:hypothetical protein